MNVAYIVYNKKDNDYYLMDKETYDKMYFQRKARYVIIYDVEYENEPFHNIKLPRPPYGLQETRKILEELIGE